MNINNISLNYYSFGYYGGLISGSGYTEPSLNLNTLTDLAKKYGLGGIEIPFDRFFNINQIEEGIKTIKKIQQNNLSVFIDLENFDIKYINNLVPKLNAECEKSYLIRFSEDWGGTIGPDTNYSIFGLFNLEGNSILLPLINFGNENYALNFILD